MGGQDEKVYRSLEFYRDGGPTVACKIEPASGGIVLKDAATLDLDAGKLREHRVKVTAKTANYTVLESDSGTWFTTEGATGTITFTLPVTVASGLIYHFVNAENYTMTVQCGSGDKMVAFNDVAADSYSFSTASEKVGGALTVLGDGTKWMTFVNLASETQTPTIAT